VKFEVKFFFSLLASPDEMLVGETLGFDAKCVEKAIAHWQAFGR